MNPQPRSHSAASVLALLVMPGVLMLVTAAVGGALDKKPSTHLIVVLSVGVMFHGMARRWLQIYAPQADYRLARRCLLTLFVTLPGAHLLVFGSMWAAGSLQDQSWQPVLAALLGVFPLYIFYFNELGG